MLRRIAVVLVAAFVVILGHPRLVLSQSESPKVIDFVFKKLSDHKDKVFMVCGVVTDVKLLFGNSTYRLRDADGFKELSVLAKPPFEGINPGQSLTVRGKLHVEWRGMPFFDDVVFMTEHRRQVVRACN